MSFRDVKTMIQLFDKTPSNSEVRYVKHSKKRFNKIRKQHGDTSVSSANKSYILEPLLNSCLKNVSNYRLQAGAKARKRVSRKSQSKKQKKVEQCVFNPASGFCRRGTTGDTGPCVNPPPKRGSGKRCKKKKVKEHQTNRPTRRYRQKTQPKYLRALHKERPKDHNNSLYDFTKSLFDDDHESTTVAAAAKATSFQDDASGDDISLLKFNETDGLNVHKMSPEELKAISTPQHRPSRLDFSML